MFRSIAFWICAALLLVLSAAAQERVSARRADGNDTPLMVYRAVRAQAGCAPLAVISHGAGGSETGYRYLATAMADLGYTAIVMGHRESGRTALMADIRTDGLKPGIQALVADPQAESARLLDVDAALRWGDAQCRPPFRVLLGHSMGAETVMLEAGARNVIGVASPPAGRDRFDAYVALSPEGPGVVFPEHAWNELRKPLLVLTGTRDQSLKGGPQARQEPWRDMPADAARQCHWLAVIDGATHMNFAGRGSGAAGVEAMVTETTADFLKGVYAGRCVAPSPVTGMTLQAK